MCLHFTFFHDVYISNWWKTREKEAEKLRSDEEDKASLAQNSKSKTREMFVRGNLDYLLISDLGKKEFEL